MTDCRRLIYIKIMADLTDLNGEKVEVFNMEKYYVTTGKARICYANLYEPKPDATTGKLKYSLTVLIPKEDTETLLAIKEAVEAAYEVGQDTLKGNNKTAPSLGSIHTPLRDGDEERPDDPVFAGMMFFGASSTYKPDIYDDGKNLIEDPDFVYSGCYCRVGLRFFAYNARGGKGIGAGVLALQKVADGDSLAKKMNTADMF